ncbi:MAG TPA: LPS export ABC transporter periplasmic protein LptC [Syntrophobacteria bacterium]|nr:LPS export ABC transporter periplasmic protein LptC [Syntrophobacteria bacterium]
MEHRFWSRIRWVVSAAMVCIVVLFVVALKQRSVPSSQALPAADKSAGDTSSLTINHMEYSDVSQGRTRYTVEADTARHYEQQQQTFLSKVTVVFFQNDGGKITLVADEGSIDHGSKNMEAHGNVHVNYNDTYELTTARLFYDNGRNLVFTPDPVLIVGQGLTLHGVGAKLEVEEHTMKVLSRVDTRLEGVRLRGAPSQG